MISRAHEPVRPADLAAPIAAGVAATGVIAELLAPSSSLPLTVADLAVGAGIGCAGAFLLGRAIAPAMLALAFAAIWFVGGLSSTLLLAHRGPLLQLMLTMPAGRLTSRRAAALAAAGWIAALLPVTAARPSTAIVAALSAIAIYVRSRIAAADHRRVLLVGAGATALLAVVWALGALKTGHPTLLLALDDVAIGGAGLLALSAAAGLWSLGAASTLAVELGEARHAGRPVSAQLVRILADPALEVHYRVPGFGWVDEQGRPSDGPKPDARAVTRASAPGGGEAALVHGEAGAADQRLAEAAAAAAALVLDAARLEADLRRRAGEVRASRRRLLTAADAERRLLEQRLEQEVVLPLRRVERMLSSRPDAGPLLGELDDAIAEIVALGRGVHPPALARADVSAALADLAARCPALTTCDVDVDDLPEQLREAAWFVCSEALANVARHAGAAHAHVHAGVGARGLEIEVRDDGCGGATVQRGLRGLQDRVEALGGRLAIDSPIGGPTIVRAVLPLSDQGLPGDPARSSQGAPR